MLATAAVSPRGTKAAREKLPATSGGHRRNRAGGTKRRGVASCVRASAASKGVQPWLLGASTGK